MSSFPQPWKNSQRTNKKERIRIGFFGIWFGQTTTTNKDVKHYVALLQDLLRGYRSPGSCLNAFETKIVSP